MAAALVLLAACPAFLTVSPAAFHAASARHVVLLEQDQAMDKAGSRRAALLAGGAAVAAVLVPAAAPAATLKEEKDQETVIFGIAAIILASPILGITLATKAISAVKDDDDERFTSNDPRSKLQAKLKQENARGKGGWR